MRRFLSPIALVLTVFAFLGANAAGLAQEATPEPDPEFPLVPDPALCTVEGRTTDEVLDIWFSTSSTPAAEGVEQAAPQTEVAVPIGIPVDDETAAEIVATVHELISCGDAGEIKRALALYTDDFIATLGVGSGRFRLTREEATAALEATSEPATQSSGDEDEIVAITNVMRLEDRRVGAFIVARGPLSTQAPYTTYVIFEQVDGRWRLDEVIEF